MEVRNFRLKQLIEQGTVKQVIPLLKCSKYEVNKTYWCGYWHKYYTVLAVDYVKYGSFDHLKSVKIRWEDGTEREHCTALDTRYDYEIVLA